MSYLAGGFEVRLVEGKWLTYDRKGILVVGWNLQGGPIYAYADDGKTPICGASLSPTGICRDRDLVLECGRCEKHRTGKSYKKKNKHMNLAKLPTDYKNEHARVMSDPNLLSMRSDVGWMEVRLRQLRHKLNEALDPENWEALRNSCADAYEMIMSRKARSEPEEFEEKVRRICNLVQSGGDEFVIWEEIERITKTKANLSAGEFKMQKDLAGMMPKEQVAALVNFIQKSFESRIAGAVTGNRNKIDDPKVKQIMQLVGMDISAALYPARAEIKMVGTLPLVEVEPEIEESQKKERYIRMVGR